MADRSKLLSITVRNIGCIGPQGLILLCYKKPRMQQGHRGRDRARWVAIWRRRVAIECGLCRSVRTGSASGRVARLSAGWVEVDVGCLERPRVA